MDSNTLIKVVKAIVAEQKTIIGPLAIDQANKVSGIHITQDLGKIEVSGESNQILSNLVAQYEKLFGKASIEACKEALKEMTPQFPSKDLPQILQ